MAGKYVNYDNFDAAQFGENIQRAIKKRKQTVDGVAAAVPVHRVTLSKVINGKQLMRLPMFLNVCHVLGISPNYVLMSYLYQPQNMEDIELQKLLTLLNQLEPDELAGMYEIAKMLENES